MREKNSMTKTCSVKECERPHYARGFCKLHYERVRKSGSIELPIVEIKYCSVEGCDRRNYGRGLCLMHYTRVRKRGGVELPTWEQRFWSNVNKEADHGCWEWLAATTNGYGQFKAQGRQAPAHRISWELLNGPIPERMLVDHRCHNRQCVNPEHLRLVTNAQNLQNRAGATRKSKSGVRGVYWNKHMKAWYAQVRSGGRSYSGGYHSTLEGADRAARELRSKLFTHDDYEKWIESRG